jgi:hypothetical protein
MELPKISPGQIIGGTALVGATVGLGIAAAVKHRRKKSRKRKTHSHKNIRKKIYRSKSRKLKFGSKAYRKKYLKHGKRKQKHPYTAGKRRDTSHRRIRYTKHNQPYIIQANGRARFISKKSVKTSKKRKGGRY